MTLNDPRGPRDSYPPRDSRVAGMGYGWLAIAIVAILIIAGIGWRGGWWEHGRTTATNPPAQTTGQGTTSTPAAPASKTTEPAAK